MEKLIVDENLDNTKNPETRESLDSISQKILLAKRVLSLCASLAAMFAPESEAAVKNEVTSKKEKREMVSKIGLPTGEDVSIEHVVLPENAKKIMVVLEQMHLIDEESMEFKNWSRTETKMVLEKVKQCQHEIYKTLTLLNNAVHTRSVFLEGVTASTEKRINNWTRSDLASYHGHVAGNTIAKAFNMQSVSMEMLSNYGLAAGATETLCAQGKISIKAIEGESEFSKTEKNLEFGVKSRLGAEEKKIFFEDRENAAIANVAKNSQEKFTVVVFGSAHDFRNNVAQFNEKNPNSQIGLISLRPKSIRGMPRY